MTHHKFQLRTKSCRFAIAAAVLLTMMSLVGLTSLHAEEVTIGNLKVSGAWARATPSGAKVGGGYLVIENSGPTTDRLIAVQAEIADHVEIHEMSIVGDTMKMRPLPNGLPIEPGQRVELKPGSFHLMFMGLGKPLVEGGTFTTTLRFEKAGEVSATFRVEKIGSKGPLTGTQSHHSHH